MRLERDRSQVLLVDVQDRLAPAIAERESVITRAGLLARGAGLLGVPVCASEQYPKGLGPTVPALRALLDDSAVLEKIHFACSDDPAILDHLKSSGRDQVLLAGIEAHVCVAQTALGLRDLGWSVFVAADAVGSRAATSRDLALSRMARAGVAVVDTEMALFEWMRRADIPEFKAVSGLIRDTPIGAPS